MTLKAHLAHVPKRRPIELWFQDEARIGQKNGLVRQWARRGTRPRQPADQRYESAYLFGAICPARGVGAALAMPFADTHAMQAHLDEIARTVARGAHAVLLLDRAGWHTTAKLVVPANISLIFLPSRAPELNPVENVWQYLRANWLSNRVFDAYNDIIDAACDAWNRLVAQPNTITSIGMRDWAHVRQSCGPLVLDEAPGHRNRGDIHCPDLVRPRHRQLAQQVGIDPVPWRWLGRVRPTLDRLDRHPLHQRRKMQAADDAAFPGQEIAQLTAPGKGTFHMQLVDLPHKREIGG